MGKKTKINNGFLAENVRTSLSGLVCVDKNYFYVKDNQLLSPRVQNFNNVQSLLHFDGTNGSTTITDSSTYGRTYSTFNSAALSTSFVKYGTASLNLTPSVAFVSTPYNAAWRWSDTDYTIEAWVYPTSTTHGGYPSICGMMSGGSNYWSFGLINNNYVSFYYYTGFGRFVTSLTTVPINQWSHIAMVYESSTPLIRIFINGVQSVSSAPLGTPAYGNLQLGMGFWSSHQYTGYIDDFRITQEAVYTDTFLPPSALPNS